MAQSLYDVIEIMKSNQVTEASKFLHDSAREIREGRTKLQDQLDAMKEITQKLLQLKELVKDLGAYSLDMTEVGQRIIDYIIGTCTDDLVVSWLQLNQNTFINILCFYLERLNYILGDFSKHRERHIDIVFVAHGRINTVFMPASFLAPSPNIRNTILYSPWNCKIDEYAAYSIAQGSIDMRNRYFKNLFNCEPNPLPDHWNYMRQSRHNIPEIILSPLVPEEPAWTQFMTLCTQGIIDIDGRAIIPYLVPKDLVTAFGEIPFMVFVFAASFMLDFYGATATVHLAACLGRAESSPMPVEWRTQYAYTYDGAFMSVNIDEMMGIPTLLRAFLLLFNRNHR